MSNKVLIIDDSIPLHKLIVAYLAPDRLKVHSVFDGEAGLSAASEFQPGLILLDVDMPRLDGFEVCRRLKANPATATIPVIFLTARSVIEDRVAGLDIGAADYISKPFKPPELRARVRAALRSRNQIETVSLVDGSTGLWNRAYLGAHVDHYISLSRRLGTPLACAIAELDRIVEFREKFGDAAAEDLLRMVGRILCGACRAEDVVCRFDAWKFAMLLVNANSAAAGLIAERLRREIERQVRARSGRAFRATCSFGVADTILGEASTLIDRADAELCGAHLGQFNHVFVARASSEILNAVA